MNDPESIVSLPENQDGTPASVALAVQMTTVINYALQQNAMPILQQLTIQNHTEQSLDGLTVRIESEPAILLPFTQRIESVPALTDFALKALPIAANATYLAGLTERVQGLVCITLLRGEEVLAEHRETVVALAYDEWHGTAFFPELVTAFVTPNHPEVTKTNARAAQFLKDWSGDPSLDAYQRKNPNRVRMQAAAVYAAMQEQNIVYSVPPASFEAIGQRVRLCDAVMQQKMGTCLDLTLFYAACLEAIGLHPLLVIQPGHIFAGVWLEDAMFSESAQDDAALLTKRLADGVNEVAVVECTALAAGKATDFDHAAAAAEQELNRTPTDWVIDVARARYSGIRPLPLRVMGDTGWHIETENRARDEITSAPQARAQSIPVAEGGVHDGAPAGKMTQWERKLLDLGLRNTLINLRMTANIVPLLAGSLGQLEDALSDGAEYGICPRPAEWGAADFDRHNLEQFADLGDRQLLLEAEFQNKRLRSAVNEGDLSRAIVNLYRSSRVSLEENGANTLYLALGLLRWYETKASERPRYAPLVLLPVEIVRKSANKGHVLRLRDEDPQMNITLLEMLKQDFGITITGLDPLPQDEHGIDLRTVFTVLRRAVMGQSRWDVVESAFLGIFSFSQFVMWNDIRNRTQDLQKNKIVRSLMDGKLAWTPQPMELRDRVPEEGVLLPIAADASQLYAIEQAANGQSFVLHGPPGTGKSQTITALIANALAQGKTVLFVAEKMAALSVVDRRLKGIGIGAFCLELHSNKSKKRDVLDQLKAATEVGHNLPGESYAEKAAQTAKLRAELDDYANALHQKQACGFSLFELVNGYELCKTASDALQLSPAFAAAETAELLEKQETMLGELTAAAREAGHPANHPLRLVQRTDYTQQVRNALPAALSAQIGALRQVDETGRALLTALGSHTPLPPDGWQRLPAIAENLSAWCALPKPWAEAADLLPLMGQIQELAGHFISAATLRAQLLNNWQESLFAQDGALLKTAWNEAALKWALPRMLAQNRIAKQLAPCARAGLDKAALPQALAALESCQKELAAGQNQLAALREVLAELYTGDSTDWPAIRDKAAQACTLDSQLIQSLGSDRLRILCAKTPALPSQLDAFLAAEHAASAAAPALNALLAPDEAALKALTPAEQAEQFTRIAENLGQLKDWTIWNAAKQQAQSLGLGDLLAAYEQGLPHEQVNACWHKALCIALISHCVDSDTVLNRFSGAVFSEKIARFKQLDARLTRLAQEEIYYRLAANVPNFSLAAATSSEVGILQRAIRSGGRGISIRSLFAQIPALLPKLCPCMLMSPLSAAQYLDPGRKPFDLVIFDEASQLPTCKAVGALARAENAVIVGDPKQMPPTSFFTGNTVDEENLEQEDLESILDDCLALNMPQSHLLWHYRSRHESLIAFSNREFYENELYTFPSVNDRESKVRLVHVDGFFDRGKTRQNRAEAGAITKELMRRAHDPALAGQSVGVVTFNISQQNLIDDLLTEACKTDSALEAWAYESAEPLFIKNLENVQGDERDVILFSIGYGPDAQGKVTMNFGPLNREGGWRRLNVAVSRARQEMVVFATLTPDQINLSRTAAQGVAALKDFLQYAAGGHLDETDRTVAARPTGKDGIAQDICAALKENGYAAQCMVGHSKYRIDVAVPDPRCPEQYLAGILLDGRSYRDARTTRDRELAQVAVLQGLGWQLHRLWTMDWWDNREKELARLLAHLKKLQETPPAQPAPPVEPMAAPAADAGPGAEAPAVQVVTPPAAPRYANAAPTQQSAPAAPQVPLYKAALLPSRTLSPEDFVQPANIQLLYPVIDEVLQTEAPISEALLMRRVTQSFGIARAGARIQEHFRFILGRMTLVTTRQAEGTFYWKAGQAPDQCDFFRASGEGAHKRDAKDVPVQEVACAAIAVLQQQVGLPQEDLVRETAKLLGYTRLGNVVRPAMQNGIDFAVHQGKINGETAGYYTL